MPPLPPLLLKSGFSIPRLGLGVYQTPASTCPGIVSHALSVGYRHFDSATGYRNESACVDGIIASTVPRSDVFFTTKLPPKLRGYDMTKESINNILETIPGLEGYIDLYLIHAPYGTRDDRIGQWRAMVEAQKEGKIRSLGVSNYGIHHLEELKNWQKSVAPEDAGILSVGQWEIHPWLMRKDIREWCEKEEVIVEAYCPLVRGQRWGEKKLVEVAEKYGKTQAQVLLKWSLQQGLVPLAKTIRNERVEENFAVWDWELSEADVKALETEEYNPCTWDPTKEPL
ncbi:2,5-diketo-D-gluconic acid reductase A [Ascodesmis nigricans]|uniref:2,5-diketo-D-gluconic acid reductase A n=1 Tax=Ascodesmis nigricans TaxID=341454 RepID=A0A4S2N0G5_9PEZI|nr:2,5-diketo-D-gluconic acid reductase A [Ascodesmis nigricans]